MGTVFTKKYRTGSTYEEFAFQLERTSLCCEGQLIHEQTPVHSERLTGIGLWVVREHDKNIHKPVPEEMVLGTLRGSMNR